MHAVSVNNVDSKGLEYSDGYTSRAPNANRILAQGYLRRQRNGRAAGFNIQGPASALLSTKVHILRHLNAEFMKPINASWVHIIAPRIIGVNQERTSINSLVNRSHLINGLLLNILCPALLVAHLLRETRADLAFIFARFTLIICRAVLAQIMSLFGRAVRNKYVALILVADDLWLEAYFAQ